MNYQAVFEMMKELNININPIDDLSENQAIAYTKIQDGHNICIIAPAGCGKSYVINKFKELNKDKIIYLTSTTGISAYNLGGMTINSFMGYGTGDADKDELLRKVYRNKEALSRISMVDTIVIDEASMMSADLFEKTEYVLRKVKRSIIPFGGIQIVLSMDPYQLCPVFTDPNVDTRLIIQSQLFLDFFVKTKSTIILDKNFRQITDTTPFVNTLLRIRTGSHDDKDIEFISRRVMDVPSHIKPVRVVVSNKKAERINHSELIKLNGQECYTYKASYSGFKELRDELEYQLKSRQQDVVKLVCGARVMLTKNINVDGGLVNGAIGTVTHFKSMDGTYFPFVKFDNGTGCYITRKEIELTVGNRKACSNQIPLILAWAFTVHKLQSCTVEYLEADLEDVFCDGQVYVALSRVKNYNNLYLKSFNKNKIFVNKFVKNFFETILV